MSRLDHASNRTASAPPSRQHVPQGLIVGVCVLILSCIGAVLYAGPAAAEVAYRLIVEGAIILVWITSAAGWGGWAIRFALAGYHGLASTGSGVSQPMAPKDTSPAEEGPHSSRAVLSITAIAIGLGIEGLAVLGMGLLGLLSQATAIVLVAMGLLLGVSWVLITCRRTPAPVPTSAPDARWNWLWLAVVPIASASLAAAFVPPGMLWKPHEPHGYDVVEYHFQIPREWHAAGRIHPTPHNAFGYFPFGVEMHYLLAFHLRGSAWDGMYLAQMMHTAMIALATLAAFGFATQFASTRRAAVPASVLGATVPWLAQVGPIGFNEGGLLLFGTLAIGWSVLAVKNILGGMSPLAGRALSAEAGTNFEEPGPLLKHIPGPPGDSSVGQHSPGSASSSCIAIRLFAIAGLCAGFACGVKLTAVPLLLVAIPIVAMLVALASPAARRRSAFRPTLLGVIVFAFIAGISFAPWLIRNAVWNGNPVFPEGRALFGDGPFAPVQADRWMSAHAARPDQQSVGRRLAAFSDQVITNPQFGYLLLPLAVSAFFLTLRSSPIARMLAGLLLIQLVVWLGFTHLQGRFFVLAIPIAMMAIAEGSRTTLITRLLTSGSVVPGVLAAVVVLLAGVNWFAVHRPLAQKLYEDQGGLAVTLGNEDLDWVTHVSLEGFPRDDPSARLVLVGDAQAFWYPLDGSRLYYRTIFDLDTSPGQSLLDAFDPQGWRRDGKTWLLITPTEVERYAKTYQPFPAIPEKWRASTRWQNGMPFLVAPVELQQWELAN